MPGPTRIEWTQRTWNPSTGCDQVSPGCAHCYAKTFAERWRGISGHPYEQGFDLRLWPERLGLPLGWRRPSVIFVNSMSDLFHEDLPDAFIRRVFDVMARADWHTFQVLTKRPERLESLAPRLPWPPNVWMGVTIENRRFVSRADALRATRAAVKFISAEPLLGRLEGLSLEDVDWLIAGGESGPRHRRLDLDWVHELRDRCREEGVAFFFKQIGGQRAGDKIDELPVDLRIREMPPRALPDVGRPGERAPTPAAVGRGRGAARVEHQSLGREY